MKLHDLRPAEGSRKERIRVGRGIAAGKGKTAGRGTKGQKARAGGSIPPWFEGGQTPLHMRIPKLRGFKNRLKVEYEVVNVGAIAELVERGAFERDDSTGKGSAPITVNQDILRAVGLVRTLNKPLKILGGGDLSTPLFVVADAFTRSAVSKIEAAGGSVNVLEMPTGRTAAVGVGSTETPAEAATETPAAEPAGEPPARTARARRSTAAEPAVAGAETEAPDSGTSGEAEGAGIETAWPGPGDEADAATTPADAFDATAESDSAEADSVETAGGDEAPDAPDQI